MLVLARGLNERIIIDGGRITIKVCEIRGGLVRLGIEAPEGCRVDREEIHDVRERERREEAGHEGC